MARAARRVWPGKAEGGGPSGTVEGEWVLIPVAAVVGVLAGLGAAGFEILIEWGRWVFYAWLPEVLGEGMGLAVGGVLLLAVPAVGGLAVGLLGAALGGRGAGHGIPNVIESLARHEGRLSVRGGVYKAGASALTIGSGGSAGVEGPILQIGSTLASVIGRGFRLGAAHANTVLGCGAAAATAAIFNAPIAGVMFVLEVVLRDFTLKTFIPIVLAAFFGTAVARAVAEETGPVFLVAAEMQAYEFSLAEVLPYGVLGLGCGVLGLAFVKTLRAAERGARRMPVAGWLRPALGGLGLGVLGLGFVWVFGSPVSGQAAPAFFGNGYPVIDALLQPGTYTPGGVGGMTLTVWALGAVLGCKLVGTCLTLASGGSGGVLAPSLFLGACLGGVLGMGLEATGWFPGMSPATYALAGMAGVLAAVAHCPLAALLLVFEITQDYKVILPMMLVTIAATFVSQGLSADSIYRAWLRDRGVKFGRYADASLLHQLRVGQVELVESPSVRGDDPAQVLLDLADSYPLEDFVVSDDAGRYVGMVVGQDVRTTLLEREAVPLLIVGELMRTGLPTVTRGEAMDKALDKFAHHAVTSLAVVDGEGKVVGLLTRAGLMARYQAALDAEA
ncbi:MAG: chloride channel protein [Planctomycetota bacterium]